MAASETMSTPNGWIEFYQTNYFSDMNQTLPPPTAATSSTYSRSRNLTPNQGRISKPLRRRARVLGRTPTTIFNTDTANFRSMVQRFTGAPIAPFAARSQPPGGGETFTLDARNEAATAINAPPAAGFHMQYSSHHPLQLQKVFTTNRMKGGGEAVSSHTPSGFSSSKDHRDYSNHMM